VTFARQPPRMTSPSSHTGAIATAASEGPAFWFLGCLIQVKLSEGALAVVETQARRGMATPLHVQPNDDETFRVLDGELTVHVGDEGIAAPEGALVFVPRGTPHAFAVASETARWLTVHTPAGHERFFVLAGEPAGERELPPAAGPPDAEVMAAAARETGFEILGPPPATLAAASGGGGGG
jgi:quercetin dioxygenase-like cupin family protein